MNLDLGKQDLSTVLDILEKYVSSYEVWAFGSRVIDKAKKFSDLDLVVMTHEPLDFKKLGELQEAFSESHLPIKVDILDWSRIDLNFQKLIKNQYVIIKPHKSPGSF